MSVTLGLGAYVAPPDAGTTIWRYQGFVKFLAFATSGRLFFPRVRALAKDDPFEGSLTTHTITLAKRLVTDAEFAGEYMAATHPKLAATPQAIVNVAHNLTYVARGWIDLPGTMFVNCWHQNSTESAALWKLYANLDQGVAIRSTIGALATSIETDREIYAGAVSYLDYDIESIPWGNAFQPIFHKRKSFEHERELRLAWWGTVERALPEAEQWPVTEAGTTFPCSVATLVQELVISPYVDAWAAEAIEKTLRGLGFTFPVSRSPMMKKPDAADEVTEAMAAQALLAAAESAEDAADLAALNAAKADPESAALLSPEESSEALKRARHR